MTARVSAFSSDFFPFTFSQLLLPMTAHVSALYRFGHACPFSPFLPFHPRSGNASANKIFPDLTHCLLCLQIQNWPQYLSCFPFIFLAFLPRFSICFSIISSFSHISTGVSLHSSHSSSFDNLNLKSESSHIPLAASSSLII